MHRQLKNGAKAGKKRSKGRHEMAQMQARKIGKEARKGAKAGKKRRKGRQE